MSKPSSWRMREAYTQANSEVDILKDIKLRHSCRSTNRLKELKAGRQLVAACGGSGLSGVPFARLPMLEKRPLAEDGPRLARTSRPAQVHALGPHRQLISGSVKFRVPLAAFAIAVLSWPEECGVPNTHPSLTKEVENIYLLALGTLRQSSHVGDHER